MRTSTLTFFVLAAVSSSSVYGAPLKSDFCTRYPGACDHFLPARQADDSGALSLSSIKNWLGIGKGLTGVVTDGSDSNQQQQRDFVDVEARDDDSEALSKPFMGHGPVVAYAGNDGIWHNIITGQVVPPPAGASKTAREDEDDEDDSGALNIPNLHLAPGLPVAYSDGDGVWHKFGTGEVIPPPANAPQARDDEEEDDSGALNIPNLHLAPGLPVAYSDGDGVWHKFGTGEVIPPPANAPQARDDDEEDSGALGLAGLPLAPGAPIAFGDGHGNWWQPGTGKKIPPPPGAEALDAREDEDDEDDSGAISFSTIAHIGEGIWDAGKALFGGGSSSQQQQQQQRREFIELLARAAEDDDESDAISFSTIAHIGEGIWDAGKALFGGGSSNQQQQQQRRDLLEMLARSDEAAELLRRIDLSNFHIINKLPLLNLGPEIVTREFSDLD